MNLPHFLSDWRRLADDLAAWSWWRFLGICIAIMIAGAVLDGLVIGEGRPHHRARVSVHEGAHKPASPQAPGTSSGVPSQDMAASKPAPMAADPQASISVAIGDGRKPLTIDIRGARNEDIQDIRDAVRELAAAVSDDSDTAAAEILAEQRAGWQREPFGYLAKLISVALLILKIIGGTRRERLAHQAADAAGAAREEAQLQRELAQTRLRQMQAQIEPHFLFNTLAALQRLITTAPDRAATMNRHLIDWLRGSLAEMRQDRTNLGQEADLLRSYFSLMQVRFEERLTWEIDIPDGLRAETIPALMLQPLVENAISHGIEPKPQGGMVRVAARMENGMLRLTVEDSGVGFTAQGGDGVGLASVRERLRLAYGDRARLGIRVRDGGGTAVDVDIPVR